MKGKLIVALLGSFAASVAMADVSSVLTVDIQGPGGACGCSCHHGN